MGGFGHHLSTLILIVFCSYLNFKLVHSIKEVEWCYDDDGCIGTSHWPGQCGSGTAQSPINLNSSIKQPNDDEREEAESLKFSIDYFRIHPLFSVVNNGHTAQIQLSENDEDEVTCIVEGAELGQIYQFWQMHFHWGANNDVGSEHTVDFRQYPMELHLVHYAKKYGDFNVAVEKGDETALAVFAIFFELTPHDNPALQSIVESLAVVPSPGESSLKSKLVKGQLNLMAFLPEKLNLWRYQGSLTTPNCDEKVVWSVFQTPSKISENQLQAFRQLNDSRGYKLQNNFRPPQPQNGRTVKILNINAQPQLHPGGGETVVECHGNGKDKNFVIAISILTALMIICGVANIIFCRLRLNQKTDQS